MIVVGTSPEDMARAANRLAEVGGGVVVWAEGRELALVELPIAGLMSDERAEIGGGQGGRRGRRDARLRLHPQQRLHAAHLLALVVIPELRISDVGLVDVTRFETVPLFV